MVLGIAGISGSGKHTAAAFLERKGWTVLDADGMAHRLYRPYTGAWKAIVKRFGEGLLTKDDLIDRQKLRAIIFDPDDVAISRKALEDLNAILHPQIRRALEEQIHRNFRRQADIAIVAALWKEIGLAEICDSLLWIEADQDRALQRIKRRDGIDEALFLHYTALQEKPDRPCIEVENNGELKEFRVNLEKAMAQIEATRLVEKA